MRVVAAALVLGLVLSILPWGGARSVAACSFARDYIGWEAVDMAVERADLIIVGKVKSVQPERMAYPHDLPESVTLSVSSVLRGRIDGPEVTFPNVREWCGYDGSAVEPGEHVLFFLHWHPRSYIRDEGYGWYIDYFAPKLVVRGDMVILERERGTATLGPMQEVLTRIGSQIGADPTHIEAAIAGERAATGWGLPAMFAGTSVLLFGAGVVVRRRVTQAIRADDDSAS